MDLKKAKQSLDKLKNIKFDRTKLDEFVDKIFSGKIDKKDLKQNMLLNLSILLRHFIIEHKRAVLYALSGIALILILIAWKLHSNEKQINEANAQFEVAISLYKRAFIDKDLTVAERAKSINDSIRRFELVINRYSGTPLKYDSIIYQGHAYFELMDFNNALKKYQELIDKKPHHYFADSVLINIGKCHEQLNNQAQAITAYQKVIDKYSKSVSVPEARFQIAKLKDISGNPAEAVQLYQSIIQEFPRSTWSQEARRRLLFLQSIALPQKPAVKQPLTQTPSTPATPSSLPQQPQSPPPPSVPAQK